MTELELRAYAKVNIGLDVLGRLENGYHTVRMIMQTISLYDTLLLEVCEDKGIALSVDRDGLGKIEENLAYKAAKLLIEEFSIEKGIKIQLKKRIPIAAGMAGGSADAAAVLRGMNQLFDLKLQKEELMRYGVSLGADVPYCIVGGTYLAEGIGEQLTLLPKIPECFILVAKPPFAVSTKWVYEHLHIENEMNHPDLDGMLEAIRQGDLRKLVSKMGNVLEQVTVNQYPEILKMQDTMEQKGAIKAMMSGSGPTVFGIFLTQQEMHKAYHFIQKVESNWELFETEMVPCFE